MFNTGTRQLKGIVSDRTEKAFFFSTKIDVIAVVNEQVAIERWIPKSQIVAMKPSIELVEALLCGAKQDIPVELWVKTWLVNRILDEIRREKIEAQKPVQVEVRQEEVLARAVEMTKPEAKWGEVYWKEKERQERELRRLDETIGKIGEKRQVREKEMLEKELGKGRKFFLDD